MKLFKDLQESKALDVGVSWASAKHIIFISQPHPQVVTYHM